MSAARKTPAKKAPVKKITYVEDSAGATISLEDAVQGHIDTLNMNNLMSIEGKKIAMGNVLKDVSAGHIDTDLEGKDLDKKVKELLT